MPVPDGKEYGACGKYLQVMTLILLSLFTVCLSSLVVTKLAINMR